MQKLKKKIGMVAENCNSPLSQWLGGEIKFVDQREVEVEYEVKAEMTDHEQNIHSGFLSVMQSEVAELMYYFITGSSERKITNINNHFIRICPMGSKIRITAKSVPGHFRQEIETTIKDVTGRITALGRITFSAD